MFKFVAFCLSTFVMVHAVTEFAQIKQFPYVVSIRTYKDNVHFCVGTIIHSKWVLTTAVCFINANGDQLTRVDAIAVYAGTLESTGKNGKSSRVTQVIVHPFYKRTPTEIENNIAVVKVKKPLYRTFHTWIRHPNVRAVAIGAVGIGTRVAVVSWGSIDAARTKIENELNYHYLTTLYSQYKNCQNSLTCLCAASSQAGNPMCFYDSGSPVLDTTGGKDKLVGMVPRNVLNSCPKTKAEPFVRIEAYAVWISETTGIASSRLL